MAAMTNVPAEKIQYGEQDMKIRKVIMKVSKEVRSRLKIQFSVKECLATFTRVEGQEAWTLWDSWSTTTGITPSFVDMAKIIVFPLKNPPYPTIVLKQKRMTRQGIEPRTFWTYTRCSNQLSYPALPG